MLADRVPRRTQEFYSLEAQKGLIYFTVPSVKYENDVTYSTHVKFNLNVQNMYIA